MAESVASALPPGAGRFIDLLWPNPFAFTTGAVPQTILNRLGVANANGASQGYIVNGGTNWSTWKGRMAAQMFATVANAPNGAQWNFESMVAQINALSTSKYPFQCDDLGVYRIYEIGTHLTDGSNNYGGDNCLELCTQGAVLISDGLIVTRGTPGVGFKLTNDNELSLIVRGTQAGPLTSTVLLNAAAGYDSTLYHCYEFRIVQATPTTQSVLKVLVDNVLLTTLAWGPGTILPTTNGGVVNGLKVFTPMSSGSQVGHFINQVRFQGSQTEIGVL